ncbi:MAG: sodium/solute symporter [Bacteroidota bacterium]
MIVDLFVVVAYFVLVLFFALRGKSAKGMTSEEYFLSSRNLKWPSIAISTIATNVQGYQFLGMMGSAYLYGLAQASLEINAAQGLWMAAFIFVPLYLKDKIVTITQFIKSKLGKTTSLVYSLANLALFSTIGLGAALFWGAYAAELVFSDYLSLISESRVIRVGTLVVFLGVFSAAYTYFGGLAAVVRTDIIQFSILLIGGILVLLAAIHHLGGWGQLYVKTPDLMHLHLSADHPKLPWISVFGLFLLNINYWCANQAIMQRSLAARSLKDAQVGLLVGGVMKYFMAVIIIVPGIALAGILTDQPLADPDQTFPYLVTNYLPVGVRGLILCALFASLMSSVDSVFNSLSTLWTIDIYKGYLKKDASEEEMVSTGRKTILVTLVTGVLVGWALLYVKFENPEAAFTHTLNEFRYYVNCGIVVLICLAAFIMVKKQKWVLIAFFVTVPFQFLFQHLFPEMNYFVRAMWVILIGFLIGLLGNGILNSWRKASTIIQYSNRDVKYWGYGLILSLILLHIIFH